MDIGRSSSSSKSCNSSSSGRSSSQLINAKIQQHRLRHCPSCGYQIPQQEWPGVPAGVKFEPSDQELILHLRAKAGLDGSDAAHPLLDEFIPTLHGLDGICSAHPERLPGVSRDGASAHFFHRPSKAYTTGNRKRRKIILHSGAGHSDGPSPAPAADTRWHKTGKTRPVFVQGRQLGCKKILVLYTNFGKHCKPHKTSWVMHQYHLGLQDDEKHGELVVSKIFFQTNPRHSQSLSAADAVAQQEMKLKSSTSASLRMNNNSSQSQSQSQGSDDFSGFGSSGGSEDTLTLARPHSPSNQHRHSNSRGRLLFCEETLVEDDEEQEHDEDEQQTIQTQTHLQSSPIFPDYDYEAAVSPANTSTTIDDAAAWVHTQTETSAADPQSNPKEECRIQQNREEGEAHDWLLYSYCWPESEPEQHQQHSSSFLI